MSYEVLGLLFVPAVVLCVHRFFESSRRSWLGLIGGMLLALPLTHHFSTVIAAVTLTVLVALWVDQRPTRITVGAGVVTVVGFWAYLLSYYAFFPPDDSGMITANPALFVAWIITIVVFAYWFRTANPSSSRGAIACVGVIGFGVLALNAIQPVFSGLSSPPPLLLALGCTAFGTRHPHDLGASYRCSIEPWTPRSRPVGRAAHFCRTRTHCWSVSTV